MTKEKVLNLEDITEISLAKVTAKLKQLKQTHPKLPDGVTTEFFLLFITIEALLNEIKTETKRCIQEAIQGLLDELMCEVKSIENQGKHIHNDYYSGLRDGYLIAIKIIKKYFP